MKINLLDKQHRVLKSQAPVTILTTDRCEGATTSLFFKALDYGYDSVVFSNNIRQTRDHFCEWFDKLGIEISNLNKVFGGERVRAEHNMGIHITFLHTSHFVEQVRLLGLNAGLYLWDDVHLAQDIEWRDIEFLVKKCMLRKQQVVFTSDKVSNGWRNPRYDKGEILYDNLGNMVLEDVSWDCSLIDWDNNDLKRHQATRCDVDNYKGYVEVIG